MTDVDTQNIDDVIAYLESPEYLRMVARVQGENPVPVLSESVTPNWEETLEPSGLVVFAEPSPEPQPTGTSRFGIQWNAENSRCDCTRCRARRLSGERPIRVTRLLQARGPWGPFATALGSLTPFRTHGRLRGVQFPEFRDSGRLRSKSTTAANLWTADHGKIDYVVYSYDTPIAWHVSSDRYQEWIFPEVKYSPTTTRHQNKIRTALLNAGTDNGHVRFLTGE